ncbi:hypothetical protein [Arenimonas sp.]|uniref:hypothetical protein n=1 Tax=Arenimonas sp. TaxID=1872635 RepID=UPI0039E6E4A0
MPAGATLLLALAVPAHVALEAPVLPAQAMRVEAFVPAGWKILQRADGDLNGDGRPDAAFVLENSKQPDPGFGDEEEGWQTFWPRITAVVLADGKGYRLLASNARFVPAWTQSNFDDVMEEGSLSIAKGVLTVRFRQFASAGSWWAGQTTFKFRLQGQDMVLIGLDRDSMHRASMEYSNISINLLNHRAKQTTGADGDEPRAPADRWFAFTGAAPSLSKIGDGLDYWPAGLEPLR